MTENPQESRKRAIRRSIVLLIVVALFAGAVITVRRAGRWLVREDLLSHADVIIVLSGGIPYRAKAAAELFRLGYGPEVWVSKPESPAAEMQQLGIHYIGEEDYNRDILIRQGVTESAVHILPETIVNTQEELEEIAREMRRTGKTRAIIVTSPQHTRRVKAIWNRVAGGDLRLLVRVATEDPFDADQWWSNTRDVFAVVREYMGLVNAWAGLPVRPHAQ